MATPKKDPKDLLPVGRKTKYNAELQAKAEEYLFADVYEQFEPIPTFAGLCVYIGINRETGRVWVTQYPEFSVTAKDLLTIQEQKLTAGALLKTYDASVAKLLLAANHGMSDKTQVDHTSSDGSMSPPSRIEIVAPDVSKAD